MPAETLPRRSAYGSRVLRRLMVTATKVLTNRWIDPSPVVAAAAHMGRMSNMLNRRTRLINSHEDDGLFDVGNAGR